MGEPSGVHQVDGVKEPPGELEADAEVDALGLPFEDKLPQTSGHALGGDGLGRAYYSPAWVAGSAENGLRRQIPADMCRQLEDDTNGPRVCLIKDDADRGG